jgi:hypothetical protein
MASDLCGQASFTERGQTRRDRYRVWHDALTPDMIRQLPAGHALVVRGGYAPVIARLAAAWNDRLYRTARRHGTAIARLAPAAQPQILAGPPAGWPSQQCHTSWPDLPPIAPGPPSDPEAAGDMEPGDGEDFPW